MSETFTAMAPLSVRLREETRDAHTAAERSPLMRAIFRGEASAGTYASLLVNLLPVYETLERAMDAQRAHPVVAAMRFEELDRREALAQDIAHFLGAGFREAHAPTSASLGYASYLEQLAERAPALIIAHAYVRYLGDLSGGQVLRKVVKKGLALPEDVGTAFYRFPRVADVAETKRLYRAGLDALALTPPESDAFVREASEAFARNLRVFDSIVAPGGDDADEPGRHDDALA